MEEVKMASIVDVVEIAQSPPPLPADLIDRESSVKTIERTFQQGLEIILLEGCEGIGKTTLARQFLERNSPNTISLFLRSIGPHTLDLQNVIFDICNQLHWVLHGECLAENVDVDESALNQYWTRLQRRASVKNIYYYIVIDGLNAITQEHIYLRDAILSMFPFGSR